MLLAAGAPVLDAFNVGIGKYKSNEPFLPLSCFESGCFIIATGRELGYSSNHMLIRKDHLFKGIVRKDHKEASDFPVKCSKAT